MSRTESILVGVVIGVLCPYLAFVLAWWTSATLAIQGILPLSERGIAIVAFTGLAVGALLDFLCLKRWIARFYAARLRLLVPLYLICSAIAVASFMGLPVGNLILGTLAGVYAGRRVFHRGGDAESLARAARLTGFFTASVTSVEALLIGLLVLKEESVWQTLQAGFGFGQPASGAQRFALVAVLSLALAIFQFWCTRAAARLAVRRRGICPAATKD